jgi:hypothetical protein
MNSKPCKNILLSYCLYPGSVASQIHQALRKRHDVRTWGPSADDENLKHLGLESLAGQTIQSDIPYDTTDPADALAYHVPKWMPDAYLWIESGVQFGVDLSKIDCPKACYLINTHINRPDDRRVVSHLQWARHFDIVFLAHEQFIKRFQNSGIHAYFLPDSSPEVQLSIIENTLLGVFEP